MKVPHLLVVNVFFAPHSYGGATVVAEQVAQALHQSGSFRISAISLCMRDDLAPYAVIKTVKNELTNYLINVPPHRSYAEMYDNPAITARLSELMAALVPDLVHVHCIQDVGTGVIAAAEAAEIPVILSVHDFWWICDRQFMVRPDEKYCGQSPVRIENCQSCSDNFWAAKTRHAHLRHMANKAAVVTYPSEFAKELCEASGLAPHKGVVWENGVRLPGDGFFEEQRQRRAADGRLTFGFVGGPSQIKGWPTIRQAFSNVQRDDFRMCLLDGSLDGSWWKEAHVKGMSGEWAILPRFAQAEMDSFYAQIDVLLFMSQWKETFGLAIREALARGISVIQTDSGGTVEHGVTPRSDCIPIGAPPDRLLAQVNAHLDAGITEKVAEPVETFEGQAHAFERLARQVLGSRRQVA